MKNKSALLFVLFLLFTFPNIVKAENESLVSAEEYLKMPLDKAFPIISKMNKEEAKVLITQIRQSARKTNPDVDKLYFLISHLEEIQAVEKEQARLKSLLWVYGLGLFLFGGFLTFVLVEQRKAIREFQRNTK